MPTRRPLQRQLLAAWCASMESDYCSQRINSERSLQASLWAQLNLILPPATRRMFIEPRLSFTLDGKQQRLYPDIVICNSRHVIAVIELKYQPRGKPAYAKDLTTLQLISRHRDQLSIENLRYRGEPRDARTYTFGESVLFVWAGVYRTPTPSFDDENIPLLSDGIRELDRCFMQLHAETDELKSPHVFARCDYATSHSGRRLRRRLVPIILP